MVNEQQHALSNPAMPAQPMSPVDPTLTQSLVFSRYVVAEIYRRIERKLGLEGIRSDDVGGPAPPAGKHNRSAQTAWNVEKEIYRLIVSRRSLAAHRDKHEPLTCDESDRAMRIARLTSFAEWVFGDDVTAGRWLRHSFRLDRFSYSFGFSSDGSRRVDHRRGTRWNR